VEQRRKLFTTRRFVSSYGEKILEEYEISLERVEEYAVYVENGSFYHDKEFVRRGFLSIADIKKTYGSR
jgi:hypothetical protein